MQKEFYKLGLVFVMISFSFVLAFFLGREVTLAGLKDTQQATSNPVSPMVSDSLPADVFDHLDVSDHLVHSANKDKKVPLEPATNHVAVEKPSPTTSSPTSSDKLLMRQKIEQKIGQQTQPQHKTQQQHEEENNLDSSASPPPIYGLFIADYSTKEQAMEKSSRLKIRFPSWKIFFKRSGSLYRVYIGPFMQKQLAEEFLNNLEKEKEFSSLRVTKILTKKVQKDSQQLK